MITKILAAKRAARSGSSTVIAYGRENKVLERMAQGEAIGTELAAVQAPWHARANWLADQLRAQGLVVLDSGAAKALLEKKTSLLPVGIKAVQGDFVRGDVVGCVAPDGTEIARGLVNYDSAQLRLIAGRHGTEFASILGFSGPEEAVHRDNMVMLAGKDGAKPQ